MGIKGKEKVFKNIPYTALCLVKAWLQKDPKVKGPQSLTQMWRMCI